MTLIRLTTEAKKTSWWGYTVIIMIPRWYRHTFERNTQCCCAFVAVPKNQSIHSLCSNAAGSQCVWFFVGKKIMPHLPGAAAGSVTASAASGRWISLAQAKKASGSPTAYFMMTLGPPWMNRWLKPFAKPTQNVGNFWFWIELKTGQVAEWCWWLVLTFWETQKGIPPNNLTYPTLGKGESSFWRVPFFVGYVNFSRFPTCHCNHSFPENVEKAFPKTRIYVNSEPIFGRGWKVNPS